MTQPLKVLIAEDNPADAELVLRELRRAGFEPDWHRVDTEAEYLKRLQPNLDIILSDYEMPQFCGLRALELLKQRGLEVPFIIISGTIGEDTAVAAMRHGAADYLLKDRLARLGPAVSHALEQGRLRRERKKAGEEMRLFRALVDQSTDTFEVIDPETGRFLDVNEKGPADLGCSRAEYLALQVFDLDPTLTAAIWAQQVEVIRVTGSVRGEGRHRRKDGTTFPIEFNAQWVRLDRDYIVTVVRDITERKQAELAMQRQAAFAQHNPNPVLELSATGEVNYCNAATEVMVRLLNREHSGQILPPGTAAIVGKCLATGKPLLHLETQVNNRNISWSFFPVPASRMVHCYASDITELKQLEQQFRHAQRLEAIGTLASGVAHDLNNILAPMLMAAGILKSKLPSERDREILAMVENGARRGAAIIRQLLTFSRGIEGARVSVQLRHLLKEMEHLMRETFPRNITIGQNLPNDLWTVLADATQMHQVIMNLCVNARDAMPEGGQLMVSAENIQLDEELAQLHVEAKPGPYVLVTVADTGTGIPPEIIQRIFDPFFTTKAIGKGTGLGLSTVIGIVKSHDGFVTVHSEPGRGTTFKVYLPATGSTESAKQDVSNAPIPMGNEELILIVDDEAPILMATSGLLTKYRYRVLTARSGEEAIKLFIQHSDSVALVLTDIMMPGIGGAELIRSLRIIKPDIKVIATSGLEQVDNYSAVTALGITGILSKPCTPELLLKAVNQALEKKH